MDDIYTVKAADLSNADTIELLMQQPKGSGVSVILADTTVTLKACVAIMHGMLWFPYAKYKIKITSKDIYFGYSDSNTINVSSGNIAKIQTKQYNKILEKTKYQIDHQEILMDLSSVISSIWNFVYKYLGNYVQTISSSKLYRLLNDPKLDKIVNIHLDNMHGVKVCELKLDQAKEELCDIIATRGTIKNNPLINFMETNSLKDNMISQMMIAYGPRSDIDDTLLKHIINRSSLEGLKTVEDYAIEYLSAKKAMWFSKNVIRNVQYSARKHKLLCSVIEKIYPGDCGSHLTIPFHINPDWRKGCLYKDIIDNGKRVTLTPDIIDNYLDKTVYLKSPTLCRHTDGFCESCAGRNNGKSIVTFPKNFHPGLVSSSEIGGTTSQNIMSTKHLISTNSLAYTLPDLAKQFFIQDGSGILLNKAAESNISKLSISVPRKSVGPLTDLSLDSIPQAITYSQIDQMAMLVRRKGTELTSVPFNLTNDTKFLPYFSENFLKYMRKMKDKLVVDDKLITVPLLKWDADLDIFNFMVVDDDMVAYAALLAKFTATEIKNYTNLSDALTAYATILYTKTSPNLFYIEIMLRALMITEPSSNYNIPVVHDIDDVHFSTLSKVISGRSVAIKMGFQDMRRYLYQPSTYMVDKPGSVYDIYLGSV